MTISKKQLADAKRESYLMGEDAGAYRGKREKEEELGHIRKSAIVELTKAAAELAQANAKLTYAMSQIANKLL